jgi:HEAT repeat protein
VRRPALRLLAALELEAAGEARRSLLAEAPDDARKAEILAATAEIGSSSLREPALACLESGSSTLRGAAARAIAAGGEPSAVEPLGKAWGKARDDGERCALVRALGRCGRGNERAREILRKAASDPRIWLRANAVVALAESSDGEPETLTLLKQRMASDPEARVRGAAAFALATARSNDLKEIGEVLRARKEKEKDARVLAMLAASAAFAEGNLEEDLDGRGNAFCSEP